MGWFPSNVFQPFYSYLTKDGEVYMDRVQLILDGLGQVEDTIFRRRQAIFISTY